MGNFDYSINISKITLANNETVENIRRIWHVGRNDVLIGIATDDAKYIIPLASIAKMEID